MSIPVYRNGTWIQYDVPVTGTSLWTKRIQLKAASFYASAVTKGFPKDRSLVLTECFINKELYGVVYTKEIENTLQSLFV